MNRKRILLFTAGFVLLAALVLSGCAGEEKNAAPLSPQESEPQSATTPQASAEEEGTMQTSMEKVTFPASDGLTVTADLYRCGKENAPFILLFHQARYSRGEYLEIAPKLCAWGYDCLAVDQRSGGQSNGVANETSAAAKEKGLPASYADAYPDLEGALSYVAQQYAPDRLIVWGSSYSSSLVLILAAEHPQEISAVLSFSPGEYFRFRDQKVADYAAKITQPVFITSAKSEADDWSAIAAAIPSEGCVFFIPKEQGVHGSSALAEATPNHAEYWDAVEGFLTSLGIS